MTFINRILISDNKLALSGSNILYQPYFIPDPITPTISRNDGSGQLCSTMDTFPYYDFQNQSYYIYTTQTGMTNYEWKFNGSTSVSNPPYGFFQFTNNGDTNWTASKPCNTNSIWGIILGSPVTSKSTPYYETHLLEVSYTDNNGYNVNTGITIQIKQIPTGVIYAPHSPSIYHINTNYDFYFKTSESGVAPAPNYDTVQWESDTLTIISGGGTDHVVYRATQIGIATIVIKAKYSNPNCYGVCDVLSLYFSA